MRLSSLGLVDRIPTEIKRRRLMLRVLQTSLAHAIGAVIFVPFLNGKRVYVRLD
mgnify:CR=1 FL=1